MDKIQGRARVGSIIVGRVRSGQSDKTRPVMCENLLTRPDPTTPTHPVRLRTLSDPTGLVPREVERLLTRE